MAKGRLDEDTINFILTAESSQLQQEIQKSSKVIKDLEEREKELRKQQAAVKAALGESSKEYKAATKAIKDTTQAIANEKQKLQEMSKQLGVNSMSMQQLRKEAKYLRNELDSTSKELEPEKWQEYAEKLREVQQRMAELKQTASGLDLSGAGGKSGGGGILDTLMGGKLGNLKSLFAAGGIVGLATAAFSKLTDMAGAAIASMRDFVAEGIEMARNADGIKHAFDNLDRPDLLKGLRQATHGTVTDLELMKAAVQANDFRIPLENLGKYLEFAQLKASQTGQSVDYLTNSIVTGLGRQSKMILDNLGISAAELTEKMEGGATMAEAVGQIIDKQLDEQGEHYETAAERATRATTELTNKQREIGEAFLPIAEKGQEMFTKLKVGAINLVLNIISYCTKLYDELATVRIVVETVRVAFDTAFKAIELGFDLVIDIVKGVGRAIVDLAKLVEGVFYLDLDGMKKAWDDLGNHIVKNATKVVNDATDVGTRWGNNFIDGINRVVKGRKVTAPKPENTLPEVTVTGKKGKQEDKKKKGGSSHDNTAKQQAEEDSKALKQFNKARQAEVDAENSSYQQRINNLKQMLADQKMTKEQYDRQEQAEHVSHTAKLLAIEKDYAEKSRNLAISDGEKAADLQDSQYKRTLKAFNDARQAEVDAENRSFQQRINNLKQMLADQKMTKEQYDRQEQAEQVSHAEKLLAIEKDYTEKSRNLAISDGEKAEQDRKALKVFNDARQAEVDAENRSFQQRINNLKQMLADQKMTKEQYDRQEQTAQADHAAKMLAIETDYVKKSRNLAMLYRKLTEQGRKDPKVFNDARQTEVDAENRSFQQRINNLKQMLADQKMTKDQYTLQEQTAQVAHAAKMLAIETDYAEKSRNLAISDGEKAAELQNSQYKRLEQAQQKSFDAQLSAQKAFTDNLSKIRSMAKDTTGLTELEKLAVEKDAQLKVLEGYYRASLEYAEENGLDLEDVNKSYQDAIASLNNKYRILEQRAVERAEQQNLQIRQRYGLVSQQELFDAELEQLKRHLEEKKITQEEYEDAVSSMRRDKWKESFDYYNRLFGDAVNALQDAELANVEAKYDAEIEAARKAGKDTSALENKKAQDQLKIQKKYADVNFAVKASQIIADTAVSIMKSYADLGPIAGSVAAALMGITGAAQLAAANSEREKIKKMTLNGSSSNTGAGARVATGLEDGGFLDVERRQDGKKFHAEFKPDKRGFVDRPTVIVGEGPRSKEWVASNSAVENPTVAPLLYDLDRAQKAGTIRTFDLKKWVVTKFPGLESGGSISQQPGDGTRYPSRDGRTADVAYRDELARLVIILDRLERNGIPATVGLDQFDAQQKIRQQSRNIARKEA